MKINSVFNRIISTVLTVFIMVVYCFGLSGCESLLSAGKAETPNKQHLCVIYAACQNNPVVASTGLLYETVSELASNFGSTMSIIVADGNPYLAYSRTFSAPDTALSASKLKSIINAYAGESLSALENAKAKTAEVDLLSAFALASRQLRSYGDDTECSILVVASGLSTVSPLDFSKNLLHASPEEMVSVLEARDYLVDLSFLDSFTWLYLGDTTSPQESLAPSNTVALKNIWSTILQECGVSGIEFAPNLPSEKKFDEQLPDVKEVSIFRTVDDPAESVFEGPVALDTDRICFKFNSCEFTHNIDDVHTVLKPYADLLASNPDAKLLIAGTASNDGGEDYNRRLSLKRAKALKAELVALNASPDQLVCVGVGYANHPYRVRIIDANGEYVEDDASNMAALLIGYDLAEAKHLLDIGLS